MKKPRRDEFVKYMWDTYPNDDQLAERTAMLKGYDFLSGQYEYEQKEKAKISKKIDEVMRKNGL